MTVQDYNNLRTRANQIRNETAGFANNEVRVGSLLQDMVDSGASGFGIDPRSYGALGTGAADDKAALLLAIAAGVAAGKPVIGNGATYGIAGNLTLIAGAWLQDTSFKQLTPGAGNVRTLTSSGGNNIRLVRVTVNRNGNGTNGTISTDAGIYISGGTGHYFEEVEVYGDDMGTGIVVTSASDFEMVRAYVHDIRYVLGADPGDDRVQGIWFVSCSDFTHTDTKAHGFGGNFGAGATQRYSRGIAYGDCNDFTVVNARAWDVDQGHDVTGGPAANERFSITGGLMRDCKTYGWKFANTARDATVTGAIAEQCGLAGFEVSGGTMLATNTCDIDFNGCVAYDTGSNGYWPNSRGFDISDNAATAGATRGIRFLNCKAHDRQAAPTMTRGFLNDTVANADGRYNEVINCRSIGHTVAAFSGMNQARVDVARSAVSVPNSAWTMVAWDTETDLGAMYSPSSGQIFARRAGIYQISVGIEFVANAVGQRGVRLTEAGGAQILGAIQLVDAAAAGVTELNVSWTKNMVAGDEIRVEVWQSSGGGLDISSATRAVVQQVG